MPEHVRQPTRIVAAGNLPKQIDEFIGRVNSKTAAVSIAHMRSPAGWVESGQTPEFDEYTVVLRGTLRVTHRGGTTDVRAMATATLSSPPTLVGRRLSLDDGSTARRGRPCPQCE